MSANKLPVSRAKTAYGLLSEIIKLTLQEPRRMRMAMWGGNPGNAFYIRNTAERPQCGTFGCIGGWAECLTNHRQDAFTTLGFGRYEDSINDLFFGKLCSDSDQGTMKHARRVVKAIRAFQRKHEGRLRRTKVVR